MSLRAKCPECGFVAKIPADKASTKNYCPRCDARLPKPTRGAPTAIILGIVGAAVALFCLVPVGAGLAWWGLRDRPDRPPAGPVANAPPVPVADPAPAPALGPVIPAAPAMPPPPDLMADGPLAPDVLEKLKAATVFVKVRTAEGLASGSGFVLRTEGDDAFLVTNHHVVEDKAVAVGRKTVRSCQVVFYSGRRTEFTMTAAVLASDDSRDLAVLRVSGIGRLPDFPHALGTAPGHPRETLPVFILGFPFGGMLATNKDNPAVTIGKGTVSSIREDDLGETSIVQLDGDINPGNSGGPVVDRQGRLIGITVAKIKGTNIGLAIPTEHLTKMLQGRISALGIQEVPTGQAGKVELQVRLAFIDPFNKVRSASVIVAPAPAVPQMPKRGPDGWGTIPGRRHEMQLAGQSATVSIPLEGTGTQFYVFQPIYSNGERDEIRAQPIRRSIAFDPKSKPTVGRGSPPFPRRPPKAVAGPKPDWKPSGKDRPIGEIVTKEIQFAGKKTRVPGKRMLPTPPCLCWSSDAKSFFALDNGANVVRRYSFPDLREEAKLAIGKECSWLCPCRDGILVTVTESQEAWILDETTLQKKSAFAVGKTPQVVSSRTSAYAYSVSDDRHFAELTINDIRTGRPVSQERIEGMASEFGTIALSPDGRRLFTVGHGLTLHAHAVDGAKVEQVAGSPGLGNGRFTGMSFSPDGEYICVPTGGGNGQFNGFERVPYGTLIFQSTDITTPVLQIKTGAYPTAVGFDMKSGLIYGQNFRENLIVFNDGGIRLKSFTVHKGRADINQFLVHPDGRRLVVLAENSGDTGATAIAVELPVPK